MAGLEKGQICRHLAGQVFLRGVVATQQQLEVGELVSAWFHENRSRRKERGDASNTGREVGGRGDAGVRVLLLLQAAAEAAAAAATAAAAA
eukprot:CAMPEP_0175155634 /NCGR_PEP_ID=MMETSP0087-20121206/21102_1 /TAXON_ID=136419 /ORGANISM="Unknown Unknown, Strain D1" /LENGTH=90 /DNA_ID=CAMNT_0016442847 /DNA_START=73 /DNA_END=343 /DNA_ORIENTATION=+